MVSIMAAQCESCSTAPEATAKDVLSRLESDLTVDSTFVSDTISTPDVSAFRADGARMTVDLDWTSSNPAVLRIDGPGSVVSYTPGTLLNTGFRTTFVGVSEGDAILSATARGPFTTATGQPVVYRVAVSVAGPPTSLKIVPAGPVSLQVYAGASNVDAAFLQPRAIVRSASGRPMGHVKIRWASSAAPVQFATARGGTFFQSPTRDFDVNDLPFVGGQSAGTARVSAALAPIPGRTLPALGDEILVNVGGGEVSIASTPQPNVTSYEVGETPTFSVTAKNAAGVPLNNPSIVWSTSRSSVATVDQAGRLSAVTASADGDTVSVLANVPTLGITGRLLLTVYRKVASISVTPNPINTTIGGGLRATARLADASGNPVRRVRGGALGWTSSTLNIARVGPSELLPNSPADVPDTVRLISGVDAGDAALTVTFPGATSAVVPIHVVSTAARIDLSIATGSSSRPVIVAGEPISVGGSLRLEGLARDADGGQLGDSLLFLTTTPSNVSVVTLNRGAASVTGLANGSATVTVRSAAAPNVSATATFLVGPVGGTAVRIDVTSSPTNGVTTPGGTVQYTGIPKDAAGLVASDCPVGWVTDRSGIATINSSGLATGGFTTGSTSVRAFCTDGKTPTFASKIINADPIFGVTQVAITPRHIYLAPGATVTYNATVTQTVSGPAAPVTWSLIATPSTNGVTIGASGVLAIPSSSDPAFGGGAKVVATAGGLSGVGGQADTSWVTYGSAGAIKGVASSASGKYLGGGTATATPTAGGASVITGFANDNNFYLAGLPAGSYTVVVRQQGNPITQTFANVIVQVGGTTLLTLTPFP